MAKQSAYLARVRQAQAIRDEEVRRATRTFQMDLVTLALGRMGWRESKFREFDKVLAEVADEYSREIIDDSKTDLDLWYSKDVMDRELRQYTGSFFVPHEQRYGR